MLKPVRHDAQKIMTDLKKFYEKIQADYKSLHKQCLDRVARWVYSTGPLFSFLPMGNEVLGLKPGREVDSAKKAKIKYGFDADGKLICSSEDLYKDGKFFTEEFLVADGPHTFRVRGQTSYSVLYKKWVHNLELVQQLQLESGGKVIQWSTQTLTESGAAKLIWDGERLIRIEGKGPQGDTLKELVYDEVGRLTEVWQAAHGHRWLARKRPSEGVTLKSLEPVIRERLLAAIKKTVETAGIREPVYCLVLAYDGEGNDVLPPCIGFGLDSERQKWSREKGKEAKDLIWNPAEFTHYEKPNTQLKDKPLEKACELFNDLLRPKENFSPAIKLLNAVAAELGKESWAGKLKVTNDFVVYAVDFELGHLTRNLKQSVPAPILARLQKAKFL